METNALCGSLMRWLETFPGRAGISAPQLTDGVVMANVLHQIDPDYFSQLWLGKIKSDVGDNWRLKVSNLRKVQQGIVDYYQEQLNQNIKHFPLPDLNKIGEHDDQEELGRMLQLILGCAVNCESKQLYIEAIMNMEENVQKVIMEAIQELMLRESSPGVDSRFELGPASFHPQLKTVLVQLESATKMKDEAMQRCLELEQQISMIGEEKNSLVTENEKLLNRLDELEIGGDLGGASTLRYKDLKKQIDELQDELFKLETSRDEYRTKADLLERENQEVQSRNDELQKLADEARTLQDEVDALREMSERAVVYEGTMETYKKKLEELSDLKRQVRILEEKNSDYMQHNMELEEEVKKSGTWRPQLEMYKKQIADFHQKLAEESKKTDRQVFENKKLTEKLEALNQEKERLIMERDGLKENIEELRCHVSTLTSPDTTSRPPSDLSDVDLLEVVPHEIRQKLIRLQHENTLLKQRAGGDSSEQLPVLQTLVTDLQERQTSLTQENRWDYKGKFSRQNSSSNYVGWSPDSPTIPSLAFFDACFSVDPSRKMKIFKKNLKWASESDLLILRQPKGLLTPNIFSNTLPLQSQQPQSLPPLPVSSSNFATQTNKENPIVIRHIHEFKLSPSPTNEDSGCCRTSPSSCEGCDDNVCNVDHSHDYAGTLDSGVSGVYAGTLESGVSGIYRCLSPVIPSIVEECTTHHVTDIIPALGGQRSTSPPVIHHSHPAHNSSCANCYFQNSSQELNRENDSREGTAARISNSCPPRPHTVCSYNPPYNYNHPSSPLPSTTPLPVLPVSPPISPVPNSSGIPLSVCLSSSVVEVSTIQTPSTVLECTNHEDILSSSSIPSAISLTSLTYSVTSPVQVSTTQNGSPSRKPSSGLSRPLITPDSPTPHNSPRLPNSIYATRSRSCKSPSNSTLISEAIPHHNDIPVTETLLIASCSSLSDTNPTGTEIQVSKGKYNSRKKISSSDSEILDRPETLDKSSVDNKTSIPTKLNESPMQNGFAELKAEYNKSNVSNRKPSSIPKKPQFTKIENFKSQNKINGSVHRTATSTEPKTTIDKTINNRRPSNESVIPNPRIVNSRPAISTNKTNTKENCGQAVISTKALTKDNSKLTVVDYKLKDNSRQAVDNKPITKDNILPVRKISPTQKYSPSSLNVKSSTVSSSTTPLVRNYSVSKSSAKSSPAISRHKKDSLSQSKSDVHVKFREPVVSEAIQTKCEKLPAHYSPASPRERMCPVPSKAINKDSTNKVNSEGPLKDTMKKKGSVHNGSSNGTSKNVTLMSDTLFTHFAVPCPKGKRMFNSDIASATDTDTDLETLERRLTLGMYAAPLVSSESCTSMSPDDADGDPSATDYCTDAEDYNPRQFKAFDLEESGSIKHTEREVLVNKSRKEIPILNSKYLAKKSLDAAALIHTYNLFRKQSKAKKQRKNSFKEGTVPPAVSGGIVKPKNKTAKHMVAETFNAMFTLCTP